MIVQSISGQWSLHRNDFDSAVAIGIKIGQGTKPGINGLLPGEKVAEDISKARRVPKGTDALSPALLKKPLKSKKIQMKALRG